MKKGVGLVLYTERLIGNMMNLFYFSVHQIGFSNYYWIKKGNKKPQHCC